MYSSRAKSASAASRTSQKPAFQKKYKERSGDKSLVIDQTQSVYIDRDPVKDTDRKSKQQDKPKPGYSIPSKNKGSNQRKRSNSVMLESSNKWCALDSDQFRNTSRKLTNASFTHHNPERCVCDLCNCGRHLCKLHGVAPNMSKASTYQKNFYPMKSIPNKVNIAKEYDKLDGPHLDMNSTFRKDYPEKAPDDLSRPKPEDLLKTGGPCPNLTSYSSEFPGHKGDNQYVKPTDKHTRGYFPLRGGSTYNNFFKGSPKKKDDWEGIPNNLKLGGTWLGDSTYNRTFSNPKPKDYPKHVKVQQKLQINPDYKKQYETSYRNEFTAKPTGVCPAKVKLQSELKGKYRDSKINFQEKMDFKALSPEFQAISTSKFSYI